MKEYFLKDYGFNNLHWSKVYLQNEKDRKKKMEMDNEKWKMTMGNKHVGELAFICELDKK